MCSILVCGSDCSMLCVLWHCFSELCKCCLRDVGTCTAQPELLFSGARDDPESEGGEMNILMHASTSNTVGCIGRFGFVF